jgi:hypothetical protein
VNDFLDTAWEQIDGLLNTVVTFLDSLISYIEFLGPGKVIFLLALSAVVVTRLLRKCYVTKRYDMLKQEFEHWKHVRELAISLNRENREKGKSLAKNIDQAKLNQTYYDYFFEGLLKNLLTTVLPVLLMMSYVTTRYTPDALMQRFGSKWIYSVFTGSSFELNISSFLWFFVCLVLSYILYAVIIKTVHHRYEDKKAA